MLKYNPTSHEIAIKPSSFPAPSTCAILLFIATAVPALAVDAVWLTNQRSGNWNTGANWTPATAPGAAGDTATFNTSAQTSLSLSADVTVDSLTFNPGASAFVINTGFFRTFSVAGTGIVNNSGATQTITNTDLSTINFLNNSTAANATIINSNSGSGAGITYFLNNSTAANATIINGNTGSGSQDGGMTVFRNTSSAASAIIQNNDISSTVFQDTATADNATITNDGAGSFTAFSENASGGNAALINDSPTAFIDISLLTAPGTQVGSVAGNGTIYLGSKNLTVGGNQQNTVFSGVISDGQSTDHSFLAYLSSRTITPYQETGGSLTKVGNGTLTLTGTNTYTGPTSINGGILSISSDANLGTAPGQPVSDSLVFNGGTLQATDTFTLDSDRGITLLAGGGTISVTPANALFYDGIIAGAGSFTKDGGGTLYLGGLNTYTGATNVNAGTLGVIQENGFFPQTAVTVASGAILTLNIPEGSNSDQSIGSLAGGGSVQLGAATLTTGNNNTNTNFSGAISGSGGLIKLGTGTQTLSGASTYTGLTTLQGGVLSISSDANLGTAPAAPVANQLSFDGGTLQATETFTLNANRGITLLAGGGTFGVTGSKTLTYGGIVTGAGSLTKIDTGTLILVGANTYTGTTTLAAGTLTVNGSLAAGSTVAVETAGTLSGTGTINGNATLKGTGIINLTDPGLIGGSLGVTGGHWNGTGRVAGSVNSSSGLFTIGDGANLTTDGDLNVTGGSIKAASTTSTITGNVNYTSSESSNFAGNIAGRGKTLTVNNSASTLVLSGTNTYTGATLVQNGNLIVDGSVASRTVEIRPGGFLGGRGILGGALINSGIVSPGNSPGTLTVNGDYTQRPDGTLFVEVAGRRPGQYDLLKVKGRARLDGTLEVLRVGDATLRVGDKITFLTADRGISGTFDTVKTDTIVNGQVTYLSTSGILEGRQGRFSSVRSNRNGQSVARALDSAAGDSRAQDLFDFLNGEFLENLPRDFDLISPEEMAAIFNIGVSLANVQSANLERRLSDIRAGSHGFSAGGFAMTGRTPDFGPSLAGDTGPEGKSGVPVNPAPADKRLGVFVTGLGEFTGVGSTDNAQGYDLSTGGVTLGVDYRLGQNFAVGLITGYARTKSDLSGDGDIKVNGGKLGLYATAFTGGFYANAAVFGGLSEYDTRRSALRGIARGSTDGGDLTTLASTGYDWKVGALTIGPSASFQYTYTGFNSFTEKGSLAPIAYDDQDAESMRTALGIKISSDLKLAEYNVRPEMRFSWQHEFGDSDYSIDSRFANGAGDSFAVSGPQLGRDSLLIGAGVSVQINDRVSVYSYYDGEIARSNYFSNNVSAGFRMDF